MAKQKTETKISVDDQLTSHLKQAEYHLISAVELFLTEPTLERPTGYFTRLVNTQESITGLHRQELVRVRGPLRRRK